jgi:hypothetical protein
VGRATASRNLLSQPVPGQTPWPRCGQQAGKSSGEAWGPIRRSCHTSAPTCRCAMPVHQLADLAVPPVVGAAADWSRRVDDDAGRRPDCGRVKRQSGAAEPRAYGGHSPAESCPSEVALMPQVGEAFALFHPQEP